MQLFVANFSKQTKAQELETLFSKYGEVESVHIFRDRETEEPLGYASVEMPDDDDAEFALSAAICVFGTANSSESANGVRVVAAIVIDDLTFSPAQRFG